MGFNDWGDPEKMDLCGSTFGLPAPVSWNELPLGTSSLGEPDYEDLLKHLLTWEGMIRHMYLDRYGYVTVGIGNLLKTVEAAKQLPFVNGDTHQPASAAEISVAFAKVSAMKPNQRAAAYRLKPSIELTEGSTRELAIDRLKKEFVPGLVKIFAEFARYPQPAQAALVDMAYNMGIGGVRTFTRMITAIKNLDWLAAAEDCCRSTCRDERNEWTKRLFVEAAHRGNTARQDELRTCAADHRRRSGSPGARHVGRQSGVVRARRARGSD